MSAIRDLIEKNIKELANTLTKTQYDILEQGLTADINAVLPPELANEITVEERVASSISHMQDAGMYDFAKVVMTNQMSHVIKSASCMSSRCIACQTAAIERDVRLMTPIC